MIVCLDRTPHIFLCSKNLRVGRCMFAPTQAKFMHKVCHRWCTQLVVLGVFKIQDHKTLEWSLVRILFVRFVLINNDII
jgi:hypothetical protein